MDLTIQQNKRSPEGWKFMSDLASALSLSRSFELVYMRWAMSSMAHSLKKRPTFITVRISRLKERGRSHVSMALITGVAHRTFSYIKLIQATKVVVFRLCRLSISAAPNTETCQ